MNDAINTFEEKYFNKVAVFISDQLSAYASKSSRVLNTFTMNFKKKKSFLL